MNPNVFGESVKGASHKRKNKECQDSFKIKECNDTIIVAVADGHGSESCPYSRSGSKIAVNVFCKIMLQYCNKYQDNFETLLTFLNREGETKIAQSIDKEWKRCVLKAYNDSKRNPNNDENDKNSILRQYGSTLIGMMITPNFIFAYQLGDGDIVFADVDGLKQVITTEKILGVETHSLSKTDSWKSAITIIKRRELSSNYPQAFFLASDGFSNSYASQEEFYKALNDYFSMIQEHGIDVVKSNLQAWLDETSEMGSGDDISFLCAYFPSHFLENEKKNQEIQFNLIEND